MSEETLVRQRHRGGARAIELDVPDATILVKRAAYGMENETRDTVRVPVFGTSSARVRVAGSITKNLGDYNSARVEVMVEVPCYPEATEIDRAYQWASSLIDQYIVTELDKATGEQPAQEGV
jgi:hypothetical protein